jgi:hypothetical protein
VKRVVIANPLQVKAIAHAHVKTDKVDAGTLASVYAAGYLPEIRTPDAATERMHRPVALPDRPAPNPDQQRRTCDPSGPPDPAMPACRTIASSRFYRRLLTRRVNRKSFDRLRHSSRYQPHTCAWQEPNRRI